MTDEFNLSKERRNLRDSALNPRVIKSKFARNMVEKVLDEIDKQDKEFIKRLKEEFWNYSPNGEYTSEVLNIIDNLTEEDLKEVKEK